MTRPTVIVCCNQLPVSYRQCSKAEGAAAGAGGGGSDPANERSLPPARTDDVDWASVEFRWADGHYLSQIPRNEAASFVFVGLVSHDDFVPPEHQEAVSKKLAALNCVPVFPASAKLAHTFYYDFCKLRLWPLLHYLPGRDGANETWDWQTYVDINNLFVPVCQRLYEERGDVVAVWIHNYHLMLLPQALRAAVPDAIVGFFLHTPFPTSEIFLRLPWRKEILLGVLAANLIGFQTYDFARHLMQSSARILGAETEPDVVRLDESNIMAKVCIVPYGVDVESTSALLELEETRSTIAQLRERYSGMTVIVGHDRVDRIKGLEHKFNAFGAFLKMYPEWVGKIKLVQVAFDAWGEQNEELDRELSRLAGSINETYGSLGYAPVEFMHRHVSDSERMGLFALANAIMVTSVRDGMNLAAHEFVLAQSKEDPGVVLMSEFCGAAESMSTALHVNPWDYEGVAQHMHQALAMGLDERVTRHETLDRYVHKQSVDAWTNAYVDDLLHLDGRAAGLRPLLDIGETVSLFKKAKKRLLLFDYDGTLAPICQLPHEAVPQDRVKKALGKLAADPNTIVYVISGRDHVSLGGWLGDLPIGLSAEHGTFHRLPGTTEWHDELATSDRSWMDVVHNIFQYYVERTPGSLIERKEHALAWHYRQCNAEFGRRQARELRNHLMDITIRNPLEILGGKAVIEVRPPDLNKGSIVRRLVEQYNADFVYEAGDDKTDEFSHEALLSVDAAVSTVVGNKATLAKTHVPSTDEIHEILDAFADAV